MQVLYNLSNQKINDYQSINYAFGSPIWIFYNRSVESQKKCFLYKKVNTQIDLALGFMPLACFRKSFSLSIRQRLSLNSLSHNPPLLLHSFLIFSRPYFWVNHRRTNSSPHPIQLSRPKRRVLRLAKPNRPHLRTALCVTETEVEWQTGLNRFLAGPVQWWRRTVPGFGLLFGRWLRVGLSGIRVLGFKGRWRYEGVFWIEIWRSGDGCRDGGGGGGGGEEVARDGEWENLLFLAGEETEHCAGADAFGSIPLLI